MKPTALSGCFWALFLAMSGVFLVSQFNRAAQKTFWQDEQFGFKGTVRNQPVFELIREGGAGQASPSPLDYLLLKALDSARRPLRYLGLHPHIYYRLVAILSTLAAAWIMGFLAWRAYLKSSGPHSDLPPVLILFAVFAFLFTANVYNYSHEMRPYSLWNALWFLTGGVFLYHPEKKALIAALLILMALTASGSVFQFAALGLAYLTMNALLQRPWKTILKESAVLFLPALLVALKYSKVTGSVNALIEGQTLGAFLHYMLTNEHVPILSSLALALCFLHRDTRPFAFPALALLILYLMGPLIYFTARARGMFFADRQFIYYGTAIPFFFLIAARIYPLLIQRWSQPVRRRAVPVALCALMGIGYLGYFHGRMATVKEHLTMREPFGFLKDDQARLSTLLRNKELPRILCLESKEYQAGIMFGLSLLSEWMPVRHPDAAVGQKTVFMTPAASGLAVSDIASRPCRSKYSLKIGQF